jgi:hypothetical protein
MEPLSKTDRKRPAARRTKKNQKKKIEFSKLIFMGVSIATAAVVVFSCRMIYVTGDLSPLAYLIPSVFAELATATGFYYRKAQKENEIKLPHYMANQTMTNYEEAETENTIQ